MEMAAELQEVGPRSYEQAEFWVSQCQRRAHTTWLQNLSPHFVSSLAGKRQAAFYPQMTPSHSDLCKPGWLWPNEKSANLGEDRGGEG